MEDVVDVGRDDQPRDGKAHAGGDIAGEDVAEIARGNGEGDLAIGRAEADRGVEEVHDLRHQPGPVDRVHRGQREPVGEAGSLNIAFTSACASSKLPSMAML